MRLELDDFDQVGLQALKFAGARFFSETVPATLVIPFIASSIAIVAGAKATDSPTPSGPP